MVISGGTVWRAWGQGVFSVGRGLAYEPWDNWRADKGPLALLRAAILAANPDNSQPWRFRVTDARMDLFADMKRNLAAIDPFQRNVHIGLGCALENLLLAAQVNGYRCQVTLLPDDSDHAHVARVDLATGETVVSDLYQAIPHRHMNRSAYDTARPVSAEMLTAIQSLGQDDPDLGLVWLTTEAQRRQAGEWIVQATEATIADKEQAADIARWTRSSWSEIQQRKDGITLDAAGLPALILAAAKMLPPLSPEQNNSSWLQMTRDTHVKTAAAFGILAVRDKQDRAQQLRAGRFLQHIHLWVTAQGLALHVMHQLPDRAGREESLGIEPRFGNALKSLVGDPAWQALSMFRLGIPTAEARRSPRRPVQDVLI